MRGRMPEGTYKTAKARVWPWRSGKRAHDLIEREGLIEGPVEREPVLEHAVDHVAAPDSGSGLGGWDFGLEVDRSKFAVLGLRFRVVDLRSRVWS